MTTCDHPDRPRYALGLCLPCYHRHYRAACKALGRRISSSMDKRDRIRGY